MSEMVERVARAMRALVLPLGTHFDQDWKSIGEGARRMYRRDARTAIGAMREPTGEMISAPYYDDILDGDIVRRVWQDMIDVALAVPSDQ